MSFKDLSVRYKIFLIGLLGFFSTLAVSVLLLSQQRSNLEQSRKGELQHLVETAVASVEDIYQKQGSADAESAKASALKLLESMRYADGTGYFWVNDMDARMIMHPVKPALNGKDLADLKDPNGLYVFREFNKVAAVDKGGFVHYQWKKPGGQDNADKVSYVTEFKPWGWVIGSGAYIDDIEATFWSNLRNVLIPLVLIYLVVGAIVHWVTSSIVNPLNRIVETFNQVADGNLNARVENGDRQDEFGQMQRSAQKMLSYFRQFVDTNRSGVDDLQSAQQKLSRVSEVTCKGMDRQYIETDTLATAIEEMAATVGELARNAAETSEVTAEASERAEQSERQMELTRQSAEQVANDIGNASTVVKNLGEDIQRIESILAVIGNISEQTNLLALNAAIEAARAGESGRGFAVVADEVRSLAKRTQDCTEEIREMTDSLQQASQRAAQVMESGQQNTHDSVELAVKTAEDIREIARQIVEINDRNTQIATAVEQQGSVAASISENVLKIREVADETNTQSRELETESAEILRLVQQMQQLLTMFKN